MRTLTWFDEGKTVIRLDLREAWTWEEFAQAYDEVLYLMLRNEQTIHCIIDLGERTTLPHGNPWTLLRRMANITPCNDGLVIHVGGGKIIESMRVAFAERFGNGPDCVRFVDTLDEAFSLCGLQAA